MIKSYVKQFENIQPLGTVLPLEWMSEACFTCILWLPVYEYIVLGNRGQTRDFFVDLPTA